MDRTDDLLEVVLLNTYVVAPRLSTLDVSLHDCRGLPTPGCIIQLSARDTSHFG